MPDHFTIFVAGSRLKTESLHRYTIDARTRCGSMTGQSAAMADRAVAATIT
jgi:hypothetical protein